MRPYKLILLFMFSIMFLIYSQSYAAHYYVDPCGNDLAAGTSWSTAFLTIQKGIDEANDGDVVEVNEGIFLNYDNTQINFNGKAITLTGKNPENWQTIKATVLVGDVILNSDEDGNTIINGLSMQGGGVYCSNGSCPIIKNCFISSYDGLICQGTGTNPTVIDNEIGSNCSYGIDCQTGACPEIRNNFIWDNDIGIHCSGVGTVPLITNNKIEGSISSILYAGGAAPLIKNNVIYNNYGGIVCVYNGGQATIQNNTIVKNFVSGIKKVDVGPAPIIKNCIIWDNNDDLYGCTATYSCIQDANSGEGNISSDPCFVDADANDFHLTSDSPCIDIGDPCGNYTGQFDIDGDNRVINIFGKGDDNNDVDMGADEFNPAQSGQSITAIASGNWSDPTAWDLGRIPAEGDDVNLANYDVTMDVNVIPFTGNIVSITSTTGHLLVHLTEDRMINGDIIAGGAAGGYGMVRVFDAGTLTVNGDVHGSNTTPGAWGLKNNGNGTVIINGDVYGGNANSATHGIINGDYFETTSTLIVNGNCIGGQGDAVKSLGKVNTIKVTTIINGDIVGSSCGVSVAWGNLTVTGNVSPANGTGVFVGAPANVHIIGDIRAVGSSAVGVNASNGTTVIDGNVFAESTMHPSYGVYLQGNASNVTINGNVSAGTVSGSTGRTCGLYINGMSPVTVNGDVYAGTSRNADGIYISNNGTVEVYGNVYGTPMNVSNAFGINNITGGILEIHGDAYGGVGSDGIRTSGQISLYGNAYADSSGAYAIRATAPVYVSGNSVTGIQTNVGITCDADVVGNSFNPGLVVLGTGPVSCSVTGNVYGGNGHQGIIHDSLGDLTVEGTITGGSGGINGVGVEVRKSCNILVVYDVIGGASLYSYGLRTLQPCTFDLYGEAIDSEYSPALSLAE